jgi:hypothetical protein
MSIHVHRNSFNAGEFSPLLDGRVDEAKYPFSCRIMQNFIPRIYGGAFRRPGTIYLDTSRGVVTWTENLQTVTKSNRVLNILVDGNAPGANDDANDRYRVGSVWLQNVRTVFKLTNINQGSATWTQVTAKCTFAASSPSTSANASQGYVTGSLWYNFDSDVTWVCTDASTGTWVVVTAKCNATATSQPGATDNGAFGYTTGTLALSSYWIRNVLTIHKCTRETPGSATWAIQTGGHNLDATRIPRGSDNYVVGSFWVNQRSARAWEATSVTAQTPVRLLPFNVSATTRHILAFGDGYLRIYNDDGTLFQDSVNWTGIGAKPILELSTPYLASEIFQVQIAQLGNLAYFAHPNHPPQKLTRFFDASVGAATFEWSAVNWTFPAFRDTNNSSVTAKPSAKSGRAAVIDFTGDPFIETMNYSKYLGTRIMLSQKRPASHVKLILTCSTGTPTRETDALSVLGRYRVYTYGTFTGKLLIEAQDKAGAWETVKSFEFSGESEGRNIVYDAETDATTNLRLKVLWTSTPTGASPVAYLEATDSSRVGYAAISGTIGGGPSVPVDIESEFDSTSATTDWAIEAWAEYAGYPRAVCFHEQRLWFGGTELQPNTIWASATGDFENFRRGAFDNDALAFTLAAEEGSAIQSLVSHSSLVIFTQSEEWTATTSEQTVITPSNIFVRRQSRFGSAHRQAFVAANNLIFLQRGSRRVRQFTYGQGEGQASDLTTFAEHVTQGGIVQMAFQQQPDPIIWCVRGDGVLLSLTYEPDQNVVAWARHTSGAGLIESVATIYGDAGEADQVWVVVNRAGKRIIERMDADAFPKLEDGITNTLVYVDSAVIIQGASPPDYVVPGLSHLNGQQVHILADGAVSPPKTVASGEVEMDETATNVVAGIPYESVLQPSKIEISMDDGTSQSRRFLCKRATLNLWKTQGVQYSDHPDSAEAKWFNVLGRSTDTPLGQPEPLFTGMVDVTNLGAHRRSVDFVIRQTLPLPCNILALVPKIEVTGD